MRERGPAGANGRHAAGNMAKHALTTPLDPFNLESREAPWRQRPRSPALGRRARLTSRIGGRLEIQVGAERSRIAERQDLRRPISADPVLSIDPVEQVGEPGPAERPGRPAGRGVLAVYHEGVGPG